MITTLSLIASVSLVLVGVGHTLAEIVMGGGEPPEEIAEVIGTMKNTRLALPGRRVSLFMLMRGFSLAMGLWLIAFGAQNLLLPPESAASVPVLVLNTVVTTAGFGIACRYFFAVPIVGTLVSMIGFGGALILAM